MDLGRAVASNVPRHQLRHNADRARECLLPRGQTTGVIASAVADASLVQVFVGCHLQPIEDVHGRHMGILRGLR